MSDFGIRFEWDEEKNIINKKKHGVSFEVARSAFFDEYAIDEEDLVHSNEIENRRYLIGKVDEILEILYIVYIGEYTTIRIISARKATRKEASRYYENRNK